MLATFFFKTETYKEQKNKIHPSSLELFRKRLNFDVVTSKYVCAGAMVTRYPVFLANEDISTTSCMHAELKTL